MSIATEIQRLQTAKADIKSAIEEKGVEVGDGTIDTYAEKINEISSGAGLPTNTTEVSGGTWTQAIALGAGGVLEIEHGLTDTPDVIVISSDVFDIKPSAYQLAAMTYEFYANVADVKFGSTTFAVYYNNNITGRYKLSLTEALSGNGITTVDETKFTIKTAGNRQLGAGVTYSWFAMRWAK